MPIFGVKSSFLELGILAVQKRELIIEEVHNYTTSIPDDNKTFKNPATFHAV